MSYTELQTAKEKTVISWDGDRYCHFESDSMVNLQRAISIDFEFTGTNRQTGNRMYEHRVTGDIYRGVWTNPRKCYLQRLNA